MILSNEKQKAPVVTVADDTAEQQRLATLAKVAANSPVVDLPGSALIPGGGFTMGDAPDGDKDAPQHKVNVSAFYMQRKEVSKAEWEKAARGGLRGKRFQWGNTISHEQANYYTGGKEFYQNGSTSYHTSYKTGEMPYTSPAGSFMANGYGLYDMTGNVWEWCWEWVFVFLLWHARKSDGSCRAVRIVPRDARRLLVAILQYAITSSTAHPRPRSGVLQEPSHFPTDAPEDHDPGNAEPRFGENPLRRPSSSIFHTRAASGSDYWSLVTDCGFPPVVSLQTCKMSLSAIKGRNSLFII